LFLLVFLCLSLAVLWLAFLFWSFLLLWRFIRGIDRRFFRLLALFSLWNRLFLDRRCGYLALIKK